MITIESPLSPCAVSSDCPGSLGKLLLIACCIVIARA